MTPAPHAFDLAPQAIEKRAVNGNMACCLLR